MTAVDAEPSGNASRAARLDARILEASKPKAVEEAEAKPQVDEKAAAPVQAPQAKPRKRNQFDLFAPWSSDSGG